MSTSVQDFRLPWRIGILTTLVGVLTVPLDAVAVDKSRLRKAEQARPEPSVRDDRVSDQLSDVRGRTDLGPLDRHPGRRWWLGVHGRFSETGMRIHYVYPNSPAWRVGLEQRDIIVCVGRSQIGYIDGYMYPLDRELQMQVDYQGWVRLLVWNHRDRRLLHMHVRLRPRTRMGPGGPIEPDGPNDSVEVEEVLGTVTFQESYLPTGMDAYLRVLLFDGKLGELHSMAELEIPFKDEDADETTVTMGFRFDEYIDEPPKGSYVVKAYLMGVDPDGKERKILSSRTRRLKSAKSQTVYLELKPLDR